MVRKARIDAPGALHYVIIRGIERQAIFKDRLDRRSFLNRMEGKENVGAERAYFKAMNGAGGHI